MVYTITYHPAPNGTHNQPNNPQQVEWITPKGWSADKTKTTFESRHPGVTVVSCEPIKD